MKDSKKKINLVRPAGFEPATFALEGHCSIQLSYERTPSLIRGRNYSTLSLYYSKLKLILLTSLTRVLLFALVGRVHGFFLCMLGVKF